MFAGNGDSLWSVEWAPVNAFTIYSFAAEDAPLGTIEPRMFW